MPNPIVTQRSLLDHPLCFPAKVAAFPFLFVAQKVSDIFQGFIGYFIRIGVFSFGEWNRSWIKKKIITIYNEGTWGFFSQGKFSALRLEQAFVSLQSLGAIRTFTYSKDGTKLDTMLIRYTDVKKAIETNGGKIIRSFPINDLEQQKEGQTLVTYCKQNRTYPSEYVDVILPQQDDKKWKDFCMNSLGNLGLEKIFITKEDGKTVEGFTIKHWDRKRPTRPKAGQCFVRSNSPTESYAMAKRDIMRRVFLEQDVLCYDPPGTWKSESHPSEGGYYLAGETMVEKAVNEYGYKWSDIWAEGFCLGGAVAVHLKKKYHEKGINLFIQNSFDRMQHTLDSQVFPASLLARFGLGSVKSNDPAISSLVEEDGFDSVRKLQSIPDDQKRGTSIIVNTSTDQTIHPLSHARLSSLADRISTTYSLLLKPQTTKGENGHRLDVLAFPTIWDKAVTYITSKDYPSVLDDRRWWGRFC